VAGKLTDCCDSRGKILLSFCGGCTSGPQSGRRPEACLAVRQAAKALADPLLDHRLPTLLKVEQEGRLLLEALPGLGQEPTFFHPQQRAIEPLQCYSMQMLQFVLFY
jgi:hypothetical protein